MIEWPENFFKSVELDDNGLLKARSHKFIRIEYVGGKKKYIYKEPRKGQYTLEDFAPEAFKQKTERKREGEGREVSLTLREIVYSLNQGTVGFVSAGRNPNNAIDKKMTDSQIKKRYGDLRKDLIDGGYAFTPVVGKYGEVEDSYMVMSHNPDEEELKQLGQKYNQDSVLYYEKKKSRLHYTTGKNQGKKNEGRGFKFTKEADNYTQIKASDNGQLKFAMNIDFDVLKALMK